MDIQNIITAAQQLEPENLANIHHKIDTYKKSSTTLEEFLVEYNQLAHDVNVAVPEQLKMHIKTLPTTRVLPETSAATAAAVVGIFNGNGDASRQLSSTSTALPCHSRA